MGSNKRKLDFYEDCIKNRKNYLTNELIALKAMEKRVDRIEGNLFFSMYQFYKAQKDGKTEYDSERYCKDKNKSIVMSDDDIFLKVEKEIKQLKEGIKGDVN